MPHFDESESDRCSPEALEGWGTLKVGVHSLPFSRFPALSVVVKAVLVLVNMFLLQMSRVVKGEQWSLI